MFNTQKLLIEKDKVYIVLTNYYNIPSDSFYNLIPNKKSYSVINENKKQAYKGNLKCLVYKNSNKNQSKVFKHFKYNRLTQLNILNQCKSQAGGFFKFLGKKYFFYIELKLNGYPGDNIFPSMIDNYINLFNYNYYNTLKI